MQNQRRIKIHFDRICAIFQRGTSSVELNGSSCKSVRSSMSSTVMPCFESETRLRNEKMQRILPRQYYKYSYLRALRICLSGKLAPWSTTLFVLPAFHFLASIVRHVHLCPSLSSQPFLLTYEQLHYFLTFLPDNQSCQVLHFYLVFLLDSSFQSNGLQGQGFLRPFFLCLLNEEWFKRLANALYTTSSRITFALPRFKGCNPYQEIEGKFF